MPDFHALVRARLGPLAVDPARGADIVDEIAQHVAEHCADLTAGGMAESDAIAAALAALDDPRRVAAEIARADRPRPAAIAPPPAAGAWLADGWRDLQYAARLLLRSPGFAAIALMTLAVGIGANTAIFSVLHAVLLRPLPYSDPDRLVAIGDRSPDGSPGNTGYTTFLDWRERTRAFDDMVLIRSWTPTLLERGEPERINAMRVSAGFFRMLGVTPALGRDFTAADDTPAGWRLLILSDGLWRRRFGTDRSVIGRAITMNDQPFTVIGVMPPSFEPLISERYYRRAEMWALVGYDRSQPSACRSCQHLKVFGRLKPGATIAAAIADVNAVHTQLRAGFPADYPPDPIAVVPLADELTGRVRPVLAMLMGAVAFVLLVACANVANLLLARMASRERDLALRAALGAGRARLIRQLLAESAVLGVGGGALGLGLSVLTVPVLTRLAPATMARLSAASLDASVLGFALALSLLTALLFGMLPAIRASRIDLQGSLHADGRRTAHAPTSLARRVLIAADVALAVVLLIGAGLMIKSVGRLLGVHPGFDADRVLSMQISMAGSAYAANEAVVATTTAIVDRLRALPGVESAAAAGQIPLGGNGDTWGFHVDGRPTGPEDPSVERYSVTPDYFSVMRIPLRRGRLFTDADRASTEPVMLVGERTARAVWPGVDPLGQRVKIGGYQGPSITVVGIVGDVRHRELAGPTTLQMYLPQAQVTDSFLTLVVRANRDLGTVANEARGAIWSVAKDVPINEVAPLTALVARSIGPRRFVMLLLEAFGMIALLMTAVGVYGVISYSVAERTREIGIRSALGASRRDIVRLIMGGGMVVVALGVAAGAAVALAATRLLSGSLYNVSATDPATFALVPLVLVAVAALAQAIPIARALRVDPTVALRQE
jgi:putative ABC transport system permease protein